MKTYHYVELGTLLKRWRSERFAQIAEFCEMTRLSIPPAIYERYESGEDLPPPEALDEMARALGHDVREALLAWAQVQFKSTEHKAFFASLRTPYATPSQAAEEQKSHPPKKIIDSNQIPESGHSETWLFGEYECEHLARYPWLTDFVIGLATVYPNAAPFEAYGFFGAHERDIFVEKYLKRWIDEGRIVLENNSLRLSKPFIHMPKTAEWQALRNELLSRTLETLIPQMTPELIAAGKSHRTIMHKVLTEEQFKQWTAKLAALEMEFSLAPNAADKLGRAGRVYGLMMLIAPRELKLPEHITQTRKKFPFVA